MPRQLFLGITLLFFVLQTYAQIARNAPLFLELKKLDATFFERGFNQCDIVYLEKVMAIDVRFYHDQAGIQDRKGFFESVKKNICGGGPQKPIRKLQEGSLEVFPLYNNGKLYGAIQKGVHHFYLREEGKEDIWTSVAKFTSVWIKEGNDWQLRDVLSYDHQSQISQTQVETSTIEKLLLDHQVPALGLGIIKEGQLQKVEVFGTLDQNRAAPYNTIFKVASLTKPVFALTILKLIDQGLLDLEEPLHPYWIDPEIKDNPWHRKLTPKLVLTHQTGFPNWRYLNETKKLAFEFEPGTKFQYSGEGFEYLRKAVEKKLGKSIEALASELIFTPLQMTDTHFWWEDEVDETRYAQNFNDQGEPYPTAKYYEANAAANLLTTVKDYGTFLTHIINGAGLSQALFAEMTKGQVQLKENNFFGLGWEIFTKFSGDEYAILHSGRDPGVNTLAILFPKSKQGYLIFLNGDNALPIYEYLLKEQLHLGKELWGRQ